MSKQAKRTKTNASMLTRSTMRYTYQLISFLKYGVPRRFRTCGMGTEEAPAGQPWTEVFRPQGFGNTIFVFFTIARRLPAVNRCRKTGGTKAVPPSSNRKSEKGTMQKGADLS